MDSQTYICLMKRIGLLSDTHNHLDAAIFRHFEQCDEIWHAGDIGHIGIARQLSAFKPFRAVHGNIDGYDVSSIYPESLRFTCEESEVFITHIGGYPGRYEKKVKDAFSEKPFQLFISGHSHILKVMFDKQWQCLHINPGAAGKQGWHKVKTLVRFTAEGKQFKDLEVIEIA
jgi:putative phosphoesterase